MEPRAPEPPAGSFNVWTVTEVAQFLRVTTKTVYGLAGRGELPSFRVGRVLRFRESDIASFVDRQIHLGLGQAAEIATSE